LNRDLQRRVAELQAVFETVPIGLAIADDPQGHHIRGNPANERLIGVGAGGELSKGASAPARYRCLHAGRELALTELPMQRAVRGETVTGQVLDVVREDGQTVTLYCSASPLFDETNQPRGAVGAFMDITSLQRAEKALRENEKQLRQTLDLLEAVTLGTRVLIAAVDREFRYTYFNHEHHQELRRLTGKETTVGMSLLDVLAEMPEDRAKALALWGRALNGETVVQTLEFGDPGRYRRWYSTRHAPIRDAAGAVVGAGEVTSDVTELVQTQQALRESEEQLRLAQAAGNVGTFDWDLATQEARCSQEYFRVLNRPARTGGKVTLADWQSWVHPDDRERVMAALQAALDGTGEAFGDYRMVGEDGEIRAILYQGQMTRDAQGRATRMLGTVLDNTERNRTEAALRESEARRQVAEAVEAERRRLFAVLEALPAMICLLTPDYRVAFANRSFREKFGESHGRRCHDCCFGRPEPCECCESEHVLKTGQPRHWEVIGPDGSVIDAYGMPFTDVDGSPRMLAMTMDITDRRKAEAELSRHREHLEELVNERTAELEAANVQLRAGNEELARFNRAMVGRELRMIELKKEVNELCAQAGQPPRYGFEFENSAEPERPAG
jgi:PAS domain S-box-containing protein